MSIFEAGRALLQSISDSEMPALASIDRLGEGDGVYGSGTGGYATIATGIPCRVGIDESSTTEMIDNDSQLKSVIDHILSFPVGTDVEATDRVTLDDGRVFEVAGDYANISNSAMRSVIGKEVT